MSTGLSRPVVATAACRNARRGVSCGDHRTAFQQSAAFSLLELLVVIGLMAALASFLLIEFGGRNQSAALPSAQATVANLVTAARLQATASGRKTRLLVQMDTAVPDRFLRQVVWQRALQAGVNPTDWEVVESLRLPAGCYVMPASLSAAAGLVENESAWKRRSAPTQSLASDLFAGQTLVLQLPGEDRMQRWTGVAFTAQGTLAPLHGGTPPSGAWLLAAGNPRPPASSAAGESPVRLVSPRQVRGVILSAYGVATLLSDPDAL